MYPQSHFLFSLLIALILAKLNVFDYKIALLIALVAVFVDIDHLIIFIIKRKDWSIKDAWNAEVKGRFRNARTFIHHWLGFLLITAVIVSLFFVNKNLFWIIGLGYYSHMFLDYAHLNILKIKEKLVIKGFGLVERINKFELLFDIFMLIGIVLLLI
jgi:hypothetical protein